MSSFLSLEIFKRSSEIVFFQDSGPLGNFRVIIGRLACHFHFDQKFVSLAIFGVRFKNVQFKDAGVS